MAAVEVARNDSDLTPERLEGELARLGGGADADALAGRIRKWFGEEVLTTGPDPRVEEVTAAWAIEVEGAARRSARVRVLTDDGSFALPLVRLGATDVFAGAATLQSGTAFRWNYELSEGEEGNGGSGGRRTLLPDVTDEVAVRIRGRGRPLEVYATHPDSRVHAGVPHGTLTAHEGWRSEVFPGTTRDWWVYVPAQCANGEPACVMVFQDGSGPKDFVPAVIDNLIASGDMPATVGVFINPGVFAGGERNRSFEYDTLSDQYARFLLDKILPEVERDVRLRQDAASRAISGLSSGGICSFTVAWERPDAFSKVLSWVGSFTDILGGHNYAPLVRKTPRKPVRVFLQDGKNDLNVPAGDWWLANLEMASALEFAGYDYTTVWGNGFHSPKHGRAILPDSLRWLWRGYTGS
ncbi:MAG TPA: alpha/beta hydrolase-fold protein [Chloroflexota bacterium]|nr:alpha/beta hydrolase-fold protein [Chloroflexota bacterium]